MARPHILIIPPWFDIDFNHNFSKSYHRWAQDLAMINPGKTGLLYGEFLTGWRPRKMFRQENIGYHYMGVSGWGLPKIGLAWALWRFQYLRAYRDYEKEFGRPDIIHGFSLLGLIAAGTIHLKYGIPFVYTEVLGSFITGTTASRLIRKAAEYVRKASCVCGISPGMSDALHRVFGVEPKLIPLYIDAGLFAPSPSPPLPPRIISIGSPAHTKGMDILVESMKFVIIPEPDARLVIVCESRDWSMLEELISKYMLEKNITLTGPVPYEDVPELIRQSHLLVSASREESMGFTMLESLSVGRPVVASPSPGAQYIVTGDRGRIVAGSPGGVEPEELGREILHVLRNRMDYSSEELHAGLQSGFGKERILETWMEIYKNASNQKPQ